MILDPNLKVIIADENPTFTNKEETDNLKVGEEFYIKTAATFDNNKSEVYIKCRKLNHNHTYCRDCPLDNHWCGNITCDIEEVKE